jgi:hypothetical protein
MDQLIQKDPVLTIAQERLQDVAHILAAGIFRLRARAALSPPESTAPPTQNCTDSSSNCLELPAIPRLSVTHGLPISETSMGAHSCS